MNKRCLIILVTFIFGLIIYNLTFDNFYSCKGNSDEQCIIKNHSIGNINVSFDDEDFVCLGDGCLERKNVINSAKRNSVDGKNIGELFAIFLRIVNINIFQIILSFFVFGGIILGLSLSKKR